MAARLLTIALLFSSSLLFARPAENTPSLELLEFIADFGDLDEQTLQLLEYHARRDLQQQDTMPAAEPDHPDHEETSNDAQTPTD